MVVGLSLIKNPRVNESNLPGKGQKGRKNHTVHTDRNLAHKPFWPAFSLPSRHSCIIHQCVSRRVCIRPSSIFPCTLGIIRQTGKAAERGRHGRGQEFFRIFFLLHSQHAFRRHSRAAPRDPCRGGHERA